MPETFLILAAGGVMLAAAVSNPREVTLQWLRLAGVIALCGCGLAIYFYTRREPTHASPTYVHGQAGLIAATVAAVLGQLAFVQVAYRHTQRAFAIVAFVAAVAAGCSLVHDISVIDWDYQVRAFAVQAVGVAGVAAMCGLVLMDMLLGHAYLTASKMTIAPFRRLNLSLAVTLVLRTVCSVIAGVYATRHGGEQFWGIYGLLVGTRWFVGLLVPAVFIYMAHDCIKRRSTQSATGILYVAGVLVFIGEIIALQLVRDTAMPF